MFDAVGKPAHCPAQVTRYAGLDRTGQAAVPAVTRPSGARPCEAAEAARRGGRPEPSPGSGPGPPPSGTLGTRPRQTPLSSPWPRGFLLSLAPQLGLPGRPDSPESDHSVWGPSRPWIPAMALPAASSRPDVVQAGLRGPQSIWVLAEPCPRRRGGVCPASPSGAAHGLTRALVCGSKGASPGSAPGSSPSPPRTPSPPSLTSAPPAATLQPCQPLAGSACAELCVRAHGPPSAHAKLCIGAHGHPSARSELPRCRDDPLALGASSDPHVDARPPQVSFPQGGHVHSGPKLHQGDVRSSSEPPLGTYPPKALATRAPPRVLKIQGIPASEAPSLFLSEAAPPPPWLSFNAPPAGGHVHPLFLPTASASGVRKQAPSLSFPVCEVRTPPAPSARFALGRP